MNKTAPESMGVIYLMPLNDLHSHPENPFAVRDDPEMEQLVDSILKTGVLVPAIARPLPDGGYQLISGHRRKHASELAGLDYMPVVILNLNDDEARIHMVDSNIQRENILPSERAKAYKMKLEALRRQGSRTDRTSPNTSAKFRADDIIGESDGISGDTVRNYIALNDLIPPLLQLVDEKKIGLGPAYQIATLPEDEQTLLLTTIDSEQVTPSRSQAIRMKKLSQSGQLNEDTMLSIMSEVKKPLRKDVTLPEERLRKYFPKSYSQGQMENIIFKLLDAWQKKRQREQTR